MIFLNASRNGRDKETFFTRDNKDSRSRMWAPLSRGLDRSGEKSDFAQTGP